VKCDVFRIKGVFILHKVMHVKHEIGGDFIEELRSLAVHRKTQV
jgi:hypothetical protein